MGKVVSKFLELILQIQEILETGNEEYGPMLGFVFLTDLNLTLNVLDLGFQEKDNTLLK
jgi:hypothetical protein